MANDRRDGSGLRGLYAITPEASDTARLVAAVERALAGGAALVQYRAKDLSPARALEQARALAQLCRGFDRLFIVNDSVDLALACRADGVHLGRDDADPARARAALPHGVIGVSCYDDAARARAAAVAGADYVAVGSMFASATKPAARRATLATIAEARRVSGLPLAAIGGITLANARAVVEAGADMLAVISALFEAADIEAAARGFADFYPDIASGTRDVRTQSRAL